MALICLMYDECEAKKLYKNPDDLTCVQLSEKIIFTQSFAFELRLSRFHVTVREKGNAVKKSCVLL